MPYASDKIRLNEQQDRRRKLTEKEKIEIKLIYEKGGISTRKLAVQFNVSKSTIQLIVNTETMAKRKKYVKENWHKYRPTKEKWAATMREHRNYKHDLYLKGEL